MSLENENLSKNGWSEYGRLVLKELERLNAGQDDLKKDLDTKFNELNQKMTEFKTTEKDVEDLKAWKEKVTEVWSTTQMKQSKDEVYNQKNTLTKYGGIILAVSVIINLIIAFKDNLFGN